MTENLAPLATSARDPISIVEEINQETMELAEKIAAKNIIPIDGFSDDVQGLVKYFSEVSGTCTNFIVMNMITSIGGVAGLRLKCVDGDYVNYGQLYTCIYGDMSVGKSPSFKPVLMPFDNRNSCYISEWNSQMKDWKSAKKNSVDLPKNKQFMLNSSTPESLDQVHDNNRNGVFIFYDELQDFFDNINAYNKGNIVGKLNSAYVNGPIIVNRKSSDYIINIPTSFYSILGSLQPLVVKKYFGNQLNGLFQRFCFVIPNAEPKDRCDRNESMVNLWANIAWKVLDMPDFQLQFDDNAKNLLKEWQKKMRDEVLGMKDINPILAGAYQKTSFFVRRIASIVHLLSKGTDITANYTLYPQITESEVEFAIRIVDVLKEGTKKVLDDISGNSTTIDNISGEKLIWLFDKHFGGVNQSALANLIGKDRSYVCRCINKFNNKT